MTAISTFISGKVASNTKESGFLARFTLLQPRACTARATRGRGNPGTQATAHPSTLLPHVTLDLQAYQFLLWQDIASASDHLKKPNEFRVTLTAFPQTS
jgi:hypothetical protein